MNSPTKSFRTLAPACAPRVARPRIASLTSTITRETMSNSAADPVRTNMMSMDAVRHVTTGDVMARCAGAWVRGWESAGGLGALRGHEEEEEEEEEDKKGEDKESEDDELDLYMNHTCGIP